MVMTEGTPNLALHPDRRVCATVSAVTSVMGKPSGQRVNLSIHVVRKVNPFDGGKGPTMSMWM